MAIDQGTKAIAVSQLARGERVEVLPLLAFEHTRNSGIAFGLAGGVSSLLIGATLVIMVGVLVFVALRDAAAPRIWLPAALLIGGALGNLADRVRDGAVTDFIDLPLWPTFNLADVAIVAGVILLLFSAERAGGRERAG